MSRICLYYKRLPEQDRWVRGDRMVRPLIRRIVRGRPQPSGVDRVFLNLRAGLDRLGVRYTVNLPFDRLRPDDRVGVFGQGRQCLEGYGKDNPIVAGYGLMTHPSEWPDLCATYPVSKFVQASEWAADVYRPVFGERCVVCPVGIDVDWWSPGEGAGKELDVLVYDKIRWDRERLESEMVQPLLRLLAGRGLRVHRLRYGGYTVAEYRALLRKSRAMVYLCEHESQGFACQEGMAVDVPVLAWDPGECLDPERFSWGDPVIPASSVPYWEPRCGVRFAGPADLPERFAEFWEGVEARRFEPRSYVVERLTLEECARRYFGILEAA